MRCDAREADARLRLGMETCLMTVKYASMKKERRCILNGLLVKEVVC